MNTVVALSQTIYPENRIEQAASAFEHLCSVRLLESSTQTLSVEIVTDSENTTVVHEFLNYLLDLSIEQQLNISP